MFVLVASKLRFFPLTPNLLAATIATCCCFCCKGVEPKLCENTSERERARGLFVNIVITISDNAGMERNKRIPRLTDPPGFF